MKKTSKLYLFFTSLFFLFSPFSLGLTYIYFDDAEEFLEINGLIINIVLILILGTVMGILIFKEKLNMPNKEEIKYLIFGLLSNVVMYFYVFQDPLNIEKFMTIYFAMILILLLYMLIIDYKKLNYELWIIAVFFFVVDFIHYEYIGSHNSDIFRNVDVNFIQRVFYSFVPLVALTLYISKIIKYKIIDTFAIIIFAIAILVSTIYLGIESDSKFILTLNLLIPFVIITDFILSIIYKRFNMYKIPFYIRMVTIILLIFIYYGEDYFIMSSYSGHGLYELIMITYVVIICNFIEFLIPKTHTQIKSD